LVQLIINKLQGHANAAIEGTEYETIIELTKRLKSIFDPNKSTDQYRGELANIYMKPNKNIFDYIGKVKELRTAIIDGETSPNGYIDEIVKHQIEMSVTDNFLNGLPSDLLIRVKLERYSSLDDAIISAIQLSKTLEAESARKRTISSYKPNTSPRADFTKPPQPTNQSSDNNLQQLPPRNSATSFIKPLIPGISRLNFPAGKICRYCKASGHLIDECRKLAYRRSVESNPSRFSINNNQNNPGNAQSVPVMTDVRRNEAQIGRPQQAPITIALPQTSTIVLSPVPNQ